MVSAVKCVNLAIHRPVPLGLIIHYIFIKKFKKLKKESKRRRLKDLELHGSTWGLASTHDLGPNTKVQRSQFQKDMEQRMALL